MLIDGLNEYLPLLLKLRLHHYFQILKLLEVYFLLLCVFLLKLPLLGKVVLLHFFLDGLLYVGCELLAILLELLFIGLGGDEVEGVVVSIRIVFGLELLAVD